MTVHAPFRFAPVAEQVYFPAWGPLVTHDVPFKDGLCGEIALEIEAKTPLLVGGARRKASKEREGEVRPIKIGRDFILPSSTLQGLFRSLLEIAAFGKVGGFVDERRYGVRDLDEAAAPFYRKRLINKVQAGFMTRVVNGKTEKWTVAPCDLKRIRFEDIPRNPGDDLKLSSRSDSVRRYKAIKSVGPYAIAILDGSNVTLRSDPNGSAWLVMTGNSGINDPAKRREFVFVENHREQELKVQEDVVRDFRHIHQNGEPLEPKKWAVNWRRFWETGYGEPPYCRPFKDGGRIPVFYIVEDGHVASLGLAFMFKPCLSG